MARSKKEIDKELMYKKILPTAMTPETPPAHIAAAPGPVEDAPVAQTPAEELLSQPDSVPEPVSEPAEKQPDPTPVPEAKPDPPKHASPITRPASTEPQLVNLMEGFVESRIDEAMKKFNCCTCDKCRKDVLAISLNKLQPYYVIEDDPNVRDMREKERASDVATALVQAILTVKMNPAH